MAYVQRTNLEDVALALQSLKWHEMVELGQYLTHVEAPEDADRDFWASVLHDWSSDRMAEHEARQKALDK